MAKEIQNTTENASTASATSVDSADDAKKDAPDAAATTDANQGTSSATSDLPNFRPGDTVRVLYKIIEGEKVRTQPYQGIVISKKGSGISKTFTVRHMGTHGIGVERIFPLNSPNIEKLEVIRKGKVRKAKLYYLRTKKGREAMRIKDRA